MPGMRHRSRPKGRYRRASDLRRDLFTDGHRPWIGLQDLRRYEPIVVATLAVLFAAGLARAVAWGLHGAPAPALIGITAVDLLLPPVLIAWLRRSLRGGV